MQLAASGAVTPSPAPRTAEPGFGLPPDSSSIWQPRWVDGHVRDAVLVAVNEPGRPAGGGDGPVWRVGQLLTELMPGAAEDGRLTLCSHTAETGQPFVVTRAVGGDDTASELSGLRLSDNRLLLQVRSVGAAAARERQLEVVRNRWQRLIDDAPLGITVTNFQGILLEVNRTLCTLLGRTPDQLVGHAFNEFSHPDDPNRLDRAQALRTGRASMDKRYLSASGETICLRISASVVVEDGEPLLLSTCEDITAEVAAKAALQRQATVDEVTGLWNRQATRAALRGRLDDAAAGRSAGVGLVVAGLDRFKVVNNSLGHAAGDLLLAGVAQRLRRALPDDVVLGRSGGDEFVVIDDGVRRVGELAAVIQEALAAPVPVGGRQVQVGASVGIAVAGPGRSAHPQADVDLLRDADTALLAAKRSGAGHVVTFDETLGRRAVSRLDEEQDLRMALERDEFVLHFQPIRAVASGAPRECEALVRWRHPARGLLAPGAFLPVAEETGLIVPLGRTVLDLACTRLARWRRDAPTARMAVNVAAEHLAAGTLTDDVGEALARHRLPASALTLEVTEATLVDSPPAANAELGGLRQRGARVAIDDFGTGYSSLAYLRDLPVDILKIDRTFVAGLGSPANDGRLFSAVVALSRSLGLATVAEGIETRPELAAVVASGVTYVQGFLTGRPEPA